MITGDIPTEKSGSIWVFICDWSTILDALSTATCLNFIGFNAATLEPHLRQFGLKPTVTGALFMLTGAVYALMNPFMGKLCEAGVSYSYYFFYYPITSDIIIILILLFCLSWWFLFLFVVTRRRVILCNKHRSVLIFLFFWWSSMDGLNEWKCSSTKRCLVLWDASSFLLEYLFWVHFPS